MSDSTKDQNVIGSGAGLTMANRANDRNVQRPRDLPGIVIFSHGVNDPGANYETVEDGLCQGLNERLDRPDMVKGIYGARYKDAAAKKAQGNHKRQVEEVANDPDTYLYERDGSTAHSVFIPFYWGYRASQKEILKDKNNSAVKLRTQYQDIRGNRLDAHFAKAGGMFNNATATLPDMFGKGFKSSFTSRRAIMGMNNYQFSGTSPDRHYQVLAAKRMAMLISEIRAVAPDETITIMAHSQGTMISLLAQAMLHDDGKRYADCLILVDSPYSFVENWWWAAGLTQPDAPIQTVQARLQTLVNIVSECTKAKHALPPLGELAFKSNKSGGRAGPQWSEASGHRFDMHGKPVTFDERDNRGRVYLYFNPQDSTVNLPNVKGIGTWGIPDTLEGKEYFWDGNHTRPQSANNSYPAMDALKNVNFRQRIWSLPEKSATPILVGAKPQIVNVPSGDKRNINGDELKPAFVPKLHGGEAVTGSGKEAPDAVSQDLALGNSSKPLVWTQMPSSGDSTVDSLKAQFNAGKGPEDQTRDVEFRGGGGGFGFGAAVITAWREETPNEMRARMSQDPATLAKNDPTSVLSSNSYHSAILRDPWNHRWGTAMDLAIGQAKTLDNKEWQALWTAIADWKTPIETIQALSKFTSMTTDGQKFFPLMCTYYLTGVFPDSVVPSYPPSLVVSETLDQHENPERPINPVINWNFNGLSH